MNVAILAFPQAVPSSVTGPYDILVKANGVFNQLFPMHKGDKFNVSLVGYPDSCLSAHPLLPIAEVLSTRKQFDLIIIPASEPHLLEEVMNNDSELIEFLIHQYNGGAELASICMGAFILAQTGLLDGKRVTTHWMGAGKFRQMFPKVMLEDDKVIIDAGGFYSCGGAFTFTTFIMYLVEKFAGRETAISLSKILLIDLHKDPQTTYNIFNLQQAHNDESIAALQKYMELHFKEALSIEKLAAKVNMSRRNLLRRFKSATGNTPSEYIQRIRIEAAKKILEETNQPIEEIPEAIGYEDYGYFLKTFKKFVSVSPTSYRKKYYRDEIMEVA